MGPIQFVAGGSIDGRPAPKSQFIDPDTGEPIDMGNIVPGVASSVVPGVIKPIASTTMPKAASLAPKATHAPLDVIKAARARLRWVRKEIKALRKLEAEEAKLERLLAAADAPLAIVRDINPKRSAK